MEDWKTIKLSECCYSISDGDHMPPPKSSFGIPFITISNIIGNQISFENCFHVPDEYYFKLNECKRPRKGDILYTVVGSFGIPVYVNKDVPFVFQRHIAILRPNEKINGKFLYYTLLNPSFYSIADQLAIGAVQRTIGLKALRDVEIKVPSVEVQNRIVNILSAIDTKIAINKRINHNLEEQIKAFYKSWLIDFEPFKGGKFIESDFGMIPDGWRLVSLEEITHTVTKGTTPSSLGYSFEDNGIPFLKVESISDNHTIDYSKVAFISHETNEALSRSIISSGDIVFSIAGSLGRFALINEISPLIMNTNQAVAIIRADRLKVSPAYLYSLFIGGWHQEYCQKNIQQAVQANLSLTTLRKMPIIIPDNTTLNEYMAVVSAAIDTISYNNANSLVLSKLRDNLLPQLISGEITC